MTRVVHLKRERYDVRIDRATKWGNPYRIPPEGRTPENEREILGKYEAHVRSRPDLMAALPELRGKVLGCWCAPRACHGDVLARLADEVLP
jgi:hypothetical protein